MLPELRRASVWRERGWRILAQQLARQIYDDGVYFEQATYYQRYTADIYLHAVILADRNGFAVPRPMRDRLALAIDHLAFLARGDGSIPVMGDDDGGRLVLLEERGLTDVRAALATSAVVLDRAEHAAVAGGVTEEVLWLLGPAGVHDAESRVGRPPPVETSKLFPIGGYAIMRSGWGEHALHAVIDCGPLGALNCGHAHADALSLELAVGACPIIVDPGTYTYTASAEARDHFRHTAAHNTVTLNGEASSVPAGPFSWEHRAEATVEQWWTGSFTDWVVGRHDGFGRLGIGASHRRSVLHVRGEYWIVVDTVDSDVASDAVAHFHAAEGATPESRAERSLVLRFPCGAERPRLFFGIAGDVDAVAVENDWISPSYGRRVRAPVVRVASRRSGARRCFHEGPERHMCGICGIAFSSRSGAEVQRSTIERMSDVIAHRGPDGAGVFVRGRIGLGHRRLSIVDPEAGQQPMAIHDGAVQIVYNGEGYNHPHIQRRLQAQGHPDRPHCDTESILRLYDRHRARLAERLRGMFAFAIWDSRNETLFIARDRFGIKPLYYALTADGSLYFGSEIKAILATGDIAARFHDTSLTE